MIRLLAFIKSNWISFTILTLAAITTLSLWPQEKLPPVPGTDKTHHIIAYAVLMFPTALRKPDNWIMLGLLFIGYSGAIELLQPYVNRYGEWMDLAANAMGVVCGLIVAEFIIIRYMSFHDLKK
jgi:VanZ family protein